MSSLFLEFYEKIYKRTVRKIFSNEFQFNGIEGERELSDEARIEWQRSVWTVRFVPIKYIGLAPNMCQWVGVQSGRAY